MIAEDVLVFGQGNNYDEAVKDYDAHLLTFLRHAEERGLKINAQKFKYRLEEVSYAGHVLTHQGLKVDSRKIEALQKMEEPTDVASVRRFLGTANYLGRFVKNLADICEPLHFGDLFYNSVLVSPWALIALRCSLTCCCMIMKAQL